MKTVYLIRHAKSSWDDPDLDVMHGREEQAIDRVHAAIRRTDDELSLFDLRRTGNGLIVLYAHGLRNHRYEPAIDLFRWGFADRQLENSSPPTTPSGGGDVPPAAEASFDQFEECALRVIAARQSSARLGEVTGGAELAEGPGRHRQDGPDEQPLGGEQPSAARAPAQPELLAEASRQEPRRHQTVRRAQGT